MNNLDTNSQGEVINLDLFYDNDLSSISYSDFEAGADGNQVTRIESSRDTLALLIGDSEKPYYKKSQLNKMRKSELLELFYSYVLGYGCDDLTKSELIDDLMNVTISRFYNMLNAEYSWHKFGENIPHNYFISRGYSQGDAIYIIDVGADYDVIKGKNYINSLLWDTPVTLILNINGVDYYDLIDDCYNFDYHKTIENIKKLDVSEYAKNWIVSNLPKEPNYN